MSANSQAEPVVIVGAGQAGLSVSYYLKKLEIPNVILERGEVANAWRTLRWDSFALNTPNWMINLPDYPYRGDNPSGFMRRDEFVSYMCDWAASFGAPVRPGVEAQKLTPHSDGFLLETSEGTIRSKAVVLATATYMQPRVPIVAKDLPATVQQLRLGEYRNPSDVAPGAVLVVGSGETGCQIVEDLVRAGRKVYLCVGRSGRLPRRYRGRDIMEWNRDLGILDRTPEMLKSPKERFEATPQLTGRDGGSNVSLHLFRDRGVTLLGRLENVTGSRLYFADNLVDELKFGDEFASRIRREIDEYILAKGLEAPLPTEDEMLGEQSASQGAVEIIPTLDLAEQGIGSVIWTTGFNWDFSWVKFPVFDEVGYPITNAGATSVPGLYFCGLNWMVKRKSGILYGVAEDAEKVARKACQHLSSLGRQNQEKMEVKIA